MHSRIGNNTLWYSLPLLVVAVILTGCAVSHVKSLRHEHAENKTPKIRSEKSKPCDYQETHIPITVTDTRILTRVTIGKSRLLAVVDTGTPTIVISRRARVVGRTHFRIRGEYKRKGVTASCRGPDGFTTHGRMKYLPEIKIGGYTLTGIGSVELDHLNNTSNQNYAILGTNVFSKVVLTVDVQKKELVVRTEAFDITHQRLKPGSVLVDFTYAGKNDFSPGVPVISAQVEGVAARLLLDTGLAPMLLTQGTAQQLKLPHESKSTGMSGPFSMPRQYPTLKGVVVTVSSIKLTNQDAVVMPSLPNDNQGALGIPLLRACRLTIDYPRRKILLEPY